jgi:hypothetical protein
MHRFIFAALFLFCSIAGAQQKPNVNLEWAFAVLSTSTTGESLIAINRDTTLHSGDQIKMMVRLTSDCFVYVIHEGSSGEISLKFPYDLKQFTTDYKVARNYYIPKGREWFKLDKNTGRETIYVLASAQRLLDLEAILGKYKDADASKKSAVAKDVVAEIRSVRKYYKTFTTVAERPISIGGNVRGLEKAQTEAYPDVAKIATGISAVNFYSKTVTIDHK